MKQLLLTSTVILMILSCSKRTMNSSHPTLPNADFDNTRWRLIRLPGAITITNLEDAFVRFDAEKKQVSGKSGCNSFTGQFKLDENKFSTTPIAVTRMMCPHEIMVVENALLKALQEADEYIISGNHLKLLKGSAVLAEFEALYLQ